MTDEPHRLKLTRAPVLAGDPPPGVYLESNGRTLYFSASMWDELMRMSSDFNRTGAAVMLNYVEHLPTRTPIHANVPHKATLEDLA